MGEYLRRTHCDAAPPPLFPRNTRRWFRQLLVIYRCLAIEQWNVQQ